MPEVNRLAGGDTYTLFAVVKAKNTGDPVVHCLVGQAADKKTRC